MEEEDLRYIRKTMAILLCMAVFVQMIGFAGATPETVGDRSLTPTITAGGVRTRAGGTVTVPLTMANNPGVTGVTVWVGYDPLLTLTGTANGTALAGMSHTAGGDLTANPFSLSWASTDAVSGNGLLAELTFSVPEDAAEGTYAISLSCRNGDVIDGDLNDLDVELVSGGITVFAYEPGDLNEDELINIKDVVLLMRYIAGGYGVDLDDRYADLNRDALVSIKDVVLLMRFIAGGYGVELLGPEPHCTHIMQATPATAATCTQAGNNAYWYCTNCGKYFSDAAGNTEIALADTVIPVTGHTLTHVAAVAATPDAEGNIEYWKCTVCEKLFSDADAQNTITHNDTVIPPTQVTTYTITYVLAPSGDTYLQNQVIENPNPAYLVEGGSVDLIPLDLPGYTFEGWYDLASGSAATNYKVLTNVNRNWKLYAHWSKDEYTINYDVSLVPYAAEKLDVNTYERTYHVDESKPVLPLDINNYIFLGWFDDEGNRWTRIPTGTTGNLTLHARYTSLRNLARPIEGGVKLDYFVENQADGVFYMVYEIGTIENVPLESTPNWSIQNVAGLSQQVAQTYSTTITEGYSQTISDTISQSTVDSSSWTLSEDWDSTTSANEEWAAERGLTVEEATERARSVAGTLSVVSETGGSKSVTKEFGAEMLIYDTKEKTTSHEFGAKLDVGGKRTVGLEIGAEANILEGVKGKAGISASNEHSVNLGLNYNYKNETKTKTGTETTLAYTNTVEKTSHWNDTVSQSFTQQASTKDSYRQAVTEMVGHKQNYGTSYSEGGSESSTLGRSSTASSSTTGSSTVNHSKVAQTGTTKTYSVDGRIEGKYRSITAGTFHVFAVVGYDVGSRSYFTNTFSIMDDETYEFLDYTPKSGNFKDNEYTILPFEIPYDAYQYVAAHTSMTVGVGYETNSLNGTATITEYTGDDTDVLIPDYVSDGGRAYRVTAISAGAFAGKTALRAVLLNQFIDEIPAEAFMNCTALQSVSGVFTKIGDRAFAGCTALDSFTVQADVTAIGEDAFAGVPSLSVIAGSVEIANAAVQAGALDLTLDISALDGVGAMTLNTPATMTSFTLQGGRKTYSDLKINSAATATVLSCLTVTGSSGVPLEIASDRLTLEEVNFSAPDFVLKETNSGTTDITLVRDSYLTSAGEKAVLVRAPTAWSGSGATGKLTVDGNMYVLEGNGNFTGKNYVRFAAGSGVEELTEEAFAHYLQGFATVTFDPNGGALPAGNAGAQEVYYGEKIADLPTPTREHYTFAGWYTQQDGGTQITTESVVTGDMTLYAHWSINTYQVKLSYNTASGGWFTTKQVAYGEAYGDFPDISNDVSGYTFAGWYTESVGGTQIYSSTIMNTEADHFLYAHWTANTYSYTVRYLSTNGTDLGTTSTPYYAFGSSYTIYPEAKTGYDTPAAQTVAWDSTTGKTITFWYQPSYVGSTTKTGEYPNATQRKAYTAIFECERVDANNVRIRLTWKDRIHEGYNRLSQIMTWSVNGTWIGQLLVSAYDSNWSVNGIPEKSATTDWVTIPVEPTRNSVSVVVNHWQSDVNCDYAHMQYPETMIIETWDIPVPTF